MKFLNDKKLAASIGVSYLKARKSQTIIAIVSVAFGITMYVSMVGFMSGMNDFTDALMVENSPHVRFFNDITVSPVNIIDKTNSDLNLVAHVKPKENLLNLKDANKAIKEMSEDPNVKAVSGVVSFQAFYRLGNNNISGMIIGIDPGAEDKLFQLKSKVIEGSYEQISVPADNMVIGWSLAKKMNVKLGDNLVVITNDGNSFRMKVSGILKTGLMSIDDQQSYVNIATAQKMMHASTSYVTEIKLKLNDKTLATKIREKYENLFDYHGSDYQKDNAVFIQGEGIRTVLSYSISITLLLVAGFGIYNILTMMIYDKMKEIAILKATGFSDKDVRWIFLTLSLVIGAVGAIVGLIFGFLLAYSISKIPYHVDVIILMDHLPVSFNPAYYITGFIFGIVTTTMASYFPSRKAAKVDPITILRG